MISNREGNLLLSELIWQLWRVSECVAHQPSEVDEMQEEEEEEVERSTILLLEKVEEKRMMW